MPLFHFTRAARLLCLAALLLPSAEAADLNKLRQGGSLRASFSTPAPGLLTQDGGSASGFVAELTALLARELGVGRVSWSRVAAPDQLIGGLNGNAFDLAFDTNLPQPLGGVALTVPVTCGGGVLLSRPGGPTNEEGLKGRRIAVAGGSTYFYYVRNLPFDKSINVFKTPDQALLSFLSGSVDVLVLDRFDALRMYRRVGPSKLQVSPLLWSQELPLVLSKSTGKATLNAVNAALKKLTTNGSFASLSTKYFGQNVLCTKI